MSILHRLAQFNEEEPNLILASPEANHVFRATVPNMQILGISIFDTTSHVINLVTRDVVTLAANLWHTNLMELDVILVM